MAHRGSSAQYPENTLPAFEAAVREGADVVELDVRLTADGVPVVMHDLDVSVTTDGQGLVHELTLDEVKRLDASKGRGPRAEVPTLREALAVLSGRVAVDIEVKNLPGEPSFDSPREKAAARVVEVLEEVGFRGPVVVTSFNPVTVARVRELAPHLPTGLLTVAQVDPRSALRTAAEAGHAFVLPEARAVLEAGEAFVREAHAEGVRVGTWTVDDPPVLERLFGMGVDAVATNRPAVAVAVRDRFRARAPAPGT
ncbi:MAG TPA: glycerophosphodiester phosphodiesterase family protein [Actinomycetota bacterium]|nr:glycerophosphodiester phosphodiesterase family protein [Actinomycetota bacterium]